MRTRGWVVKCGFCYWTTGVGVPRLGRQLARVFLTKMCAVAARDVVCNKDCCKVFRLTSRRK